MRQSREAKAETHQAIIAQAARLFRAQGVEATSVADVMKAAERTHGGFYRHFDTKDALLAAALDAAFADMMELVRQGTEGQQPQAALQGFFDFYLGSDHVADAGSGCPVASLSGEIRQASDDLRARFGAGVRAMIAALEVTQSGDDEERRRGAARLFAMAMGAVAIARASDPETAQQVLSACGAPD